MLQAASDQRRKAAAAEPVQDPREAISRPVARPPLSSFTEALLAGLARDGGLYVPADLSAIVAEPIAGFAGISYAEVADR